MSDNTVKLRNRARVLTHENEGGYTLEIDFRPSRDCSISLTCWKNGERPSVDIWTGNHRHDFEAENVDCFREWVALVIGHTET
jgi:hypothetical protein